jgi:hypothetical protein
MPSSTIDCVPGYAVTTTFEPSENPEYGESTPEEIRERSSISSSETVGHSIRALISSLFIY